MKSMSDLMLDHLRDIYYAEKLAVKNAAKVSRAVENEELKAAVLKHQDITKGQIGRLEQVFGMLGKKPRAKKCAAMDGLNEEGNEAIDEGETGPVLDAGLLANAQAIEHYEIARYGAMVAWAKAMKMDEAAGLLSETLAEEKACDQELNEIAYRHLNIEAAESEAESDDDEEEKGEKDESPEPEPAPKKRAKAPAKSKAKAAPPPEPEPEPAPAPKASKKPTRKPAARK